MRAVILVLLLCSQADASNLFERYKYRANNGCYYYGYRPYTLAPLKPEYHNQSVQYNYTVNYNQPAAHQGNTVYGVSDIASFYGAVDFGAAFHQAGRLAEGAQRLSEKATSGFTAMLETTSSDRTKVAAILAQGQAASQALIAAKPDPALVKQIASMPHEERPQEVAGGSLEATSQACAVCHGAAAETKGGGVHLPALADLSKEQAEIAREYVTRLDSSNCARKANLSHAAQQELIRFLCNK
jgi:mono/diheme cytochrome c family protein